MLKDQTQLLLQACSQFPPFKDETALLSTDRFSADSLFLVSKELHQTCHSGRRDCWPVSPAVNVSLACMQGEPLVIGGLHMWRRRAMTGAITANRVNIVEQS